MICCYLTFFRRYALLQFRLPDGSAIRNQFEGSAAFADVEQWVSQEINMAASSFQLVQMFPRREFTAENRTQSLSDLGLTPNAVLMVLPVSYQQLFMIALFLTLFLRFRTPVEVRRRGVRNKQLPVRSLGYGAS